MRAVRIKAYGGPEVLDIVDLPDPKPGPAEVLVRMKHTGVNVMDVKTRNGDYDGAKVYGTSLPTQLGMEGAGIVEAVGTDVRDVAVGDRVAYCLVWNSYAELADRRGGLPRCPTRCPSPLPARRPSRASPRIISSTT